MRPRLRTVTLAGVLALGTLLVTGANDAKAQVFLSTPGFSLGLGAPFVGAYPAYPVVPGYGVAPIVPGYVGRPYPYAYGRPGFYGPRPYPYAHHGGYGYRRW